MSTTWHGPAQVMNISSPNLAVDDNGPKYTFHNSSEYQNTVSFHCAGEEMLRLGPNAFYVRGKKVEVDDKEAQTVYNSFKEWLTWQQLTRG
jgi:hypothetical protein